MAYTAILDACVIYSAPLRDILLRLALTDLYRAKWSADIHEEWMRNLLANRPDVSKAAIASIRDKMDAHVRDAVVENYSSLIPGLALPDPADRHVLAAAIVGRADLIVTYNLKDFPSAALSPYGIEAQHPDEFLRHQFDLAPDHVLSVVRDLRSGLKTPPLSAENYLKTLERHGLTGFAAALRTQVTRM
jgi:predicted nucleic acid-binding protein